MRFNSYSSEGIILSKKNYNEADRILMIYSKEFGKVKLLAKGVRKPKSRKRGHLEIFSHVKFSAIRGNGINIITEVETIDSYDLVRKDLKKITVAYYMCEVLLKLTIEDEKNDVVFNDSIAFLSQITLSNNLKALRKDFIVKMLINLGFWTMSKKLDYPDKMLEDVIEKRVNSFRVGRAILS